MSDTPIVACKECGTHTTATEFTRTRQCPQCGHNEATFVVENPRCDFCSHPEPRYSYPCRDFRQELGKGTAVPMDGGSAGEWAACIRCHRFIERQDREGLAQRSAKRFMKNNADAKRLGFRNTLRFIRETHDNFWANREGPPTEIKETTHA
jgi:hypothetical protein